MAKGKAITVGWRYFLGMHMVLCHGPVDQVEAISFGDRLAWEGLRVGSGDIYVNNPELFGGKQREGGVVGTVHVAMGEQTQGQNPYLLAKLGSTVPAFRGVLSMIFNHFEIGSNNPYVKSLAIRIKRVSQGWKDDISWYPGTADIGGAMNAAHIVYECLTNDEWGMGYPISTIDDAQFRQSADTLFAENFGLCLQWTQQSSIKEFIQTVVDHVGAAVRTDQKTGLFQFKLFRDDYNVGTLALFDEDNIISLESFERPNWGETTNEIVVNYTNMLEGSVKTIYAQDLANIAIQSQVVSASREYPGIVSDDIAARIVIRDLKAVSSTLVKVTLLINRKAYELSKGDVIKFNWAEHGIIGMALRVLTVDTGDLLDGTVRVEAIEDIFGLPNTSYVATQVHNWQDPSAAALPITDFKHYELSFWDIATTLTAADLSQLDEFSSFVGATASSPGVGQYGFSIAAQPDYEFIEEEDFCPSCLLTTNLNRVLNTISYTSEQNIEAVEVGTYAYLDNEALEILSINTTTKVITVKRGILDTIPVVHSSGSKIWFSELYMSTINTEFTLGDSISYKLLTIGSFGALNQALAPTNAINLVGRFGRPYPPANVLVNAEYYPLTVETTNGQFTVSWVHRNRLTQTASFIGFYEGNVAIELNVEYNLVVRKSLDNSILFQQLNIVDSFCSINLQIGTYDIIIEVESVRSSLASMQKFVHECEFIYPEATRIMENGDVRITESGDIRIIN